jgi:hypothetical protein
VSSMYRWRVEVRGTPTGDWYGVGTDEDFETAYRRASEIRDARRVAGVRIIEMRTTEEQVADFTMLAAKPCSLPTDPAIRPTDPAKP